MQTRVLTVTDLIELQRLLNFAPKNRKNRFPSPGLKSITNFYVDDTEPLFKVFGAIDEFGVLHAAAFSVFSSWNRSWILRYVIKHPYASSSTIINVCDAVISFAEQANFYQWYACYFNDQDGACERALQRKSQLFSRYSTAIEEKIPKNCRSSFSFYWDILQAGKMYLDPIVVKQYVLPNQFRTFITSTNSPDEPNNILV